MSATKPLKILVAVKRVVDPNIRVLLKSDGSAVDLDHIKMSMNPFDEIALEEAVRLKEKSIAGEVIALSVGPAKCSDTLRSAVAMGADRAIHITTDEKTEPLLIAKILAKVADREAVDMIFLGKQAIDDDANQTGQMTAALLDWGQACHASEIKIANNCAEVTCEIDSGQETLAIALPCVITADLRLNQPRFISLMQLMKAKKHTLEEETLDNLGIEHQATFEVLKVDTPPQRQPATMVNNLDELLDFIKNCDISLN